MVVNRGKRHEPTSKNSPAQSFGFNYGEVSGSLSYSGTLAGLSLDGQAAYGFVSVKGAYNAVTNSYSAYVGIAQEFSIAGNSLKGFAGVGVNNNGLAAQMSFSGEMFGRRMSAATTIDSTEFDAMPGPTSYRYSSQTPILQILRSRIETAFQGWRASTLQRRLTRMTSPRRQRLQPAIRHRRSRTSMAMFLPEIRPTRL